jgi:hypothetical protein
MTTLRRPRYLLLATAALLACAIAATPAEAAKRKVPFGFYGTVFGNSQAERLTDAQLDAQVAKMASSGVETLRYTFSWPEIEPRKGAYAFAAVDRVVTAAARHRLEVVPIVVGTPKWASTKPKRKDYYLWAPRNPKTYSDFLRVLIRRYGPKGSLWATSGTPKVAIRNWQIWNEPAADFFWATRPWQPSYVRLLKPAYKTVHRADRGATVLLGGLAGVSSGTPWAQLRQLYRVGAKRYFDAVPAHFFSSAPSVKITTQQTLSIVSLLRTEMRRAHDRRKKIWFTELTWTAAQGKIPNKDLLGFETTPKGQAARLRTVFAKLGKSRKRLGLGRVLWYNWASEYISTFAPGGPGSLTFQYAGLNKIDGTTFTTLPLLATYTQTVARFEGCRKTTDARRCR